MIATARRNWQALPGNLRGACWIVLAGIAFVMMSAMIKLLAQNGLPALEISFLRTLFGLLTILSVIWFTGGLGMVKTEHLKMHVTRAALGLTTLWLYTFAVIFLPLVDLIAIGFSKPLVMIVLGLIFLGERLDPRRGIATVIGFIGVLFILRPTGDFQWAGLLSLGAVLSISLGIVVVKRMPHSEHPYAIIFYINALMLPFTILPGLLEAVLPAGTVPGLTAWSAPTPLDWLYIVLLGFFAIASQLFVVYGVRAGEASAVMPFDYLRIFVAALLGHFVFLEVTSPVTWLGAAIIIASTLYIGRREAMRKSDGAKQPQPVAGD